jgi:hypothetical protein
MGLLRCIKYFLGGLSQNELKNKFLDKKKNFNPDFSATIVAEI